MTTPPLVCSGQGGGKLTNNIATDVIIACDSRSHVNGSGVHGFSCSLIGQDGSTSSDALTDQEGTLQLDFYKCGVPAGTHTICCNGGRSTGIFTLQTGDLEATATTTTGTARPLFDLSTLTATTTTATSTATSTATNSTTATETTTATTTEAVVVPPPLQLASADDGTGNASAAVIAGGIGVFLTVLAVVAVSFKRGARCWKQAPPVENSPEVRIDLPQEGNESDDEDVVPIHCSRTPELLASPFSYLPNDGSAMHRDTGLFEEELREVQAPDMATASGAGTGPAPAPSIAMLGPSERPEVPVPRAEDAPVAPPGEAQAEVRPPLEEDPPMLFVGSEEAADHPPAEDPPALDAGTDEVQAPLEEKPPMLRTVDEATPADLEPAALPGPPRQGHRLSL